LKIPVISNIHEKVLAAVSAENALEMKRVHTCETTHCRAGWVIALAGKEGFELEEKTSWQFAANAIYHASSKIEVGMMQFFKSNDEAMADIKRCAELEILQNGDNE
jgi:hypothetical protein